MPLPDRSSIKPAARILLVDDEDLLSWCLEMELGSLGFRVRTADTLRMAHDVLETFEPDLIICDQGLPDGRGTEFVKRLQRPVPVIMMTAFTPPLSEELEAGGVRRLLRKPFDLDVLTREVTCILNSFPPSAPSPCSRPPPSAAGEG